VRRQVLERGDELELGAVTADAGADRLPGVGMGADLARQRQPAERPLQSDLGRIVDPLQRYPLGLRIALGLAELDIVAEGALAHADRQPGLRVVTEQAREGGRRFRLAAGLTDHLERPGVAAVRVVRAADEGP